jgi:hypothetical protein
MRRTFPGTAFTIVPGCTEPPLQISQKQPPARASSERFVALPEKGMVRVPPLGRLDERGVHAFGRRCDVDSALKRKAVRTGFDHFRARGEQLCKQHCASKGEPTEQRAIGWPHFCSPRAASA